MKAIKWLIGGALGIGVLYAVGKTAYEFGKTVNELETKLAEAEKRAERAEQAEKNNGADTDGDDIEVLPPEEETEDEESDEPEQPAKRSVLGSIGKILFRDKKKKPGIFSSLLRDPDGAKIEAFVENGNVRINIQPKQNE